MSERYRNADWLFERYHVDGWTQKEMAEECDVSPRTIRTWMKRRDIETRDMEGENHPLFGQTRDETVREKISDTLEGREFSTETQERMAEAQKGVPIPESVREKISDSLAGRSKSESTRKKMSESRLGSKNPRWKGGQSNNYGPGWSRAQRIIRERDSVCQNCGADDDDALLDVHHIVPLRLFENKDGATKSDAHHPANLILLCRPCHLNVHHGDLSFTIEPQYTLDYSVSQ